MHFLKSITIPQRVILFPFLGSKRKLRHQPFDVISQSYGKGDNCERWIRVATGWKHRGPCDKKIRYAMDAAVLVYYAFLRIRVHARGSHVMPTSSNTVRGGFIIQFNI